MARQPGGVPRGHRHRVRLRRPAARRRRPRRRAHHDPGGGAGRILRLADTADAGWTATLDGRPLTRTTVDGWAQGFQLPTSGGRLDLTYDDPIGHTAWLWTQGALAVVLVVLALPGRRRDVDDDLPEEPAVPAEPVAGEGRRARRLRAQSEAEEAVPDEEFPSPPQEETPVVVPQQQSYGEWDTPSYAGTDYETYGGQQYQGTQQYPAAGYDQQPYQADPYQAGQYDPYAYGGPSQPAYDQQPYQQDYEGYEGYEGYDAPYDQQQPQQQPPQHPHGPGSERPDGSQQ